MKLKMLVFIYLAGCVTLSAQKEYPMQSPDGKLQLAVTVEDELRFSLTHDGTPVLAPSAVGMTLQDGTVLGKKPKVAKLSKTSVNRMVSSPFYKKSEVKDAYNEMTLSFRGNYGLVFRLYDEGLAYRFVTRMKGDIVVVGEEAGYVFDSDYKTFAPYVNSKAETFDEQFFNSFEQPYVNEPITRLDSKRLMILPFMVELNDGKKLCITEADLEDFPGMFLNNSSDQPLLKAVHATYPKSEEQGIHNTAHMEVKERENFIAKTNGTRSFPWRVFVVSAADGEMADCDMVYRLASPSRVEDASWVKPGKVVWDWWHDWNLYGVDFRAGMNNETYKYYIDFASQQGIEYVIMDAGWSASSRDLTQVVPEIDLPSLVAYGRSKQVDLILWAGYYSFSQDVEKVVKHFAAMGIKGFKVDFMDRDDQKMVNFIYHAAEVCAENRMLLDFHGAFKPTGLQRTYPNVVNYEGVNGLEQMKWSPASYDMVTYDVTIPFIRMLAGPMDYTQGAMRNATRSNYQPNYSEPMSQGTRCRQLAMYVVFESPLNMLCDSPCNYMQEVDCIGFISGVPTVWEETKVIGGKVGEYIAMARRQGNEWFLGALTNWEAREMELDLSFLAEGAYTIELFKDGINADRSARDYKKEVLAVPSDRKLKIKMAPGGGYAARIFK